MPKFNDKSQVPPQSVRDLAERLELCAQRFRKVADDMESKGITELSLAIDTFREATLKRLESFTRTVDREYLNQIDHSSSVEKLKSEAKAKLPKPRSTKKKS